MTRFTILLLLLSVQVTPSKAAFSVPEPKVMLSEADVVAVATLSKNANNWTLTLKEVLKGDYRAGESVPLSSLFDEIDFSFEDLQGAVGAGEFLFVGKQARPTRVLQPSFGLASAWPQGTIKDLLPERTMAECIRFAKTTLGLPLLPDAPKKALPSAPPAVDKKDQAEAKPEPKPPTQALTGRTMPPPVTEASTPAPVPAAQTSSRTNLVIESPEVSKSKPVVAIIESPPTTRWPVWAAVIAAAIGLLWLAIKKRK